MANGADGKDQVLAQVREYIWNELQRDPSVGPAEPEDHVPGGQESALEVAHERQSKTGARDDGIGLGRAGARTRSFVPTASWRGPLPA